MTFNKLKAAIKHGERALEEAEVGSQAVAHMETEHLRELMAAVRAHYSNIMTEIKEAERKVNRWRRKFTPKKSI